MPLPPSEMQHFASAEALTSFVERQSHHQRCKTLVEVGRTSVLATPPDSAALRRVIYEMAQPSQLHYHRLLSAYAVRGVLAEAHARSTDVDGALCDAAVSLLNDPSEKVAQLVMTPLLQAQASPLTATRTTLAASFSPSAFLTSARLPQFKAFALKMRQCGQQSVLAHLYATQTITDPMKQQYLLGMLPPDDFEKLPEEAQASLDSAALRLLCCSHGAWVADYLSRRVEAQVATTQMVDALLKRHVLQAFSFLATHGGARHALALFTATAHHLALDRHGLQELLRRYFLRAFPAEVAEYLLDGKGSAMFTAVGQGLEMALSRRAAKRLAGQNDLILRMMDKGLLQSARRTPRHLPAEVRQRVYDTQRSALLNQSGVMSCNNVQWLPRAADRASEARANYAHRELQDRPPDRIGYLRCLPLPEALKLADAFVTSNDVNVRIDVIHAVLDSLRYFPEYVEAALDFCLQRTKEQDPWKVAMYEAWSDLPRGFWQKTAAHISDATLVEKVQQLLDATYGAKDLSDGTLYSVQQLLCNMLGPHPDFALPQLVRLIDKRKDFDVTCGVDGFFTHLASVYPSVLPTVATQLLSVAQQLLKDNKCYTYVNIMEAFFAAKQACVARVLLKQQDAAVQARMEKTVKVALEAGITSNNAHAARTMYELHNRLFPAEAAAFTAELLKKNLDWVTEDGVQKLVCNVLQGPLLDRFVLPFSNIPTGRFYHDESTDSPLVCQLPLSFAYRWTAQQQQTYATSILRLLYGESNANLFQDRGLVMALAQLPSVPSTTTWTSPDGESYSLLTLATTDHPKHGDYLKGFALQALGVMDGDASALGALQSALEVPERRLDALRALTKTLRRATSAEAVRVLEPLLTGKQVTAQKEALYLLGSKCDEVAYARLVQFAAQRRLPMPEVDDEGNVVAAAAEDGESTTKNAEAQQQPGAVAGGEGAELPAMHRDVRTALVTTLFHYLGKPQVWAYYARLLKWDTTGVEAQNAAGKGDAAAEEEDQDKAEQNASADDEQHEDEDGAEHAEGQKKEVPCPSAAACEALTTLPWISLRRPWQLLRYQTVLMELLHHPKRNVCVAALHKLAEVPPYASLELCQAAADYLDDCTNPHLVRSALKCMLRCTAEETVPYVISAILNVQADPSLEIVTGVLTSLAISADAAAQPRYQSLLEGVVSQLIVARRQPTLMVRLIHVMPPQQLAPQLTALHEAGLLHVGASCAALEAMRNCNRLMRNRDEAVELEASTLRTHPLPLLRRIGLEVVVLTYRRDGWTDAGRAAVEAYRQDSDLWVSSDASLVRMN